MKDGAIHDMDATINTVISASHSPLSIIIVGIGEADFSKMDILDGDDGLYNSNGQKAVRDLVQFVPFNKYKGNPQILAQKVLEELPDQLVEYFQLIGRKPNPPTIVDITKMTGMNENTENFGKNLMKGGFLAKAMTDMKGPNAMFGNPNPIQNSQTSQQNGMMYSQQPNQNIMPQQQHFQQQPQFQQQQPPFQQQQNLGNNTLHFGQNFMQGFIQQQNQNTQNFNQNTQNFSQNR